MDVSKLRSNVGVIICVVLLFAMYGCASLTSTAKTPETVSAVKSLYKEGTYIGEGTGRNGPVKVEVTFSKTAIQSIKVLQHNETKGMAEIPIQRIPRAVIDNQSLAVDAVSTATLTSNAILEGVAACVRQAGGDVNALKTVAVKKVKAGELKKKNADIVIIGGGGAGMAAAVAAAENGASVIIVEKTAALGGNTVRSGGAFNAAYPPVQKKQKMTPVQLAEIKRLANLEPKDSHMREWQKNLKSELEEYEAAKSTYLFDSIYLHMIQTYVDGDYFGNPVLIESMCKNAPITYEWMAKRGFIWKDSTSTFVGALWPRCHVARDYKSGIGFIETLVNYSKSKSLPIDIILEVKATDLISRNGKIAGVKGTGHDGTPYEFTAKRGVILTAGGFGANVEMRVKYNSIWPDLGKNVKTTNSPAIVGDGIIMAEAIGANLVGMDKIQLIPLADPKTGETTTIVGESANMWVNKKGVRFVNEYGRRDVLSAAILKQPGGIIYIISSQQNSRVDKNGLNTYGLSVDKLIKDGVVYRADTLEDLAKQIGVDPKIFVATVAKYNKAVDVGYDEEFGRKGFASTSKIEGAPFYACSRYPSVHHTMGGVQVDVDGHAIDKKGNIIPGLYAAGEVTGGFHGGNRLGGNAISDALTNGRITGTNAALGR